MNGACRRASLFGDGSWDAKRSECRFLRNRSHRRCMPFWTAVTLHAGYSVSVPPNLYVDHRPQLLAIAMHRQAVGEPDAGNPHVRFDEEEQV